MALDRDQLRQLRGLIERRCQALNLEVQVDVSRARGDTDLFNELAREGADMADQAALKQLVRVDDAELSRDLDELALMQAARSRLEAGTYGQCADCQRNISYERLRAQPAALRCLDCQRAVEQSSARPSGPRG